MDKYKITPTSPESSSNKTNDLSDKVSERDAKVMSRGFKCFDDAFTFMDTPYFKGLDEVERVEFETWLKKIK